MIDFPEDQSECSGCWLSVMWGMDLLQVAHVPIVV